MDLSDGKVMITLPDMLKLLGVVAAIGISYAMASSRLSLIEQGIRDGQQAVITLGQSVKSLEENLAIHKDAETAARHNLELRLQSLEDRVYGDSRRPPRSSGRTSGDE